MINHRTLAQFSPSARSAGQLYVANRAVLNGQAFLSNERTFIEADIQRSAQSTYHVTLTSTNEEPFQMTCECAQFASTRRCVHGAALALAWVEHPEWFAQTNVQTDAPIQLTNAPENSAGKQKATTRKELRKPPAVQIDANMTIHVEFSETPGQILALAETIGELRSASRGMGVYEITPSSLQRGLHHGLSVSQIVSALADAVDVPLPATFEPTLADWADAQDNFHLYDSLVVMELADDYALQEILRTSGARRYFLHIFSPRLVAVHSKHVNDLIAELEQRGFMPKIA